MGKSYEVELAILGGGPAGYLAAVRASQLGVTTAIIENNQFGGVCLNSGCIPTKALLRTVELSNLARKGQEFGVAGSSPVVSWAAGHNRKGRIVKSLRMGVEHLLQNERITIIRGRGAILTPQCIAVQTVEDMVDIHCKKILVATGSTPIRPNIPGIESPLVLTSDELLMLEVVPKRLVIIGGGVIGLEFAQMFNGLGTKVSVIEMAEQILPHEDEEIASEILKSLKRQGIQVYVSSRVTAIVTDEIGAKVQFEGNGKDGVAETDCILLAVGRKAWVPQELIFMGVGLNSQGALIVNQYMQTTIPGIYAAGDVIGGKLLAHKAYAEGRVAVENAVGSFGVTRPKVIPSCVYIQPELATVGLNEKEALEQGYSVKTGRFYFRHNGRALCLGDREGFVKVVTDSQTQVILGAQIYGPQATELISELTLAVVQGIKAGVLADMIHPHPTLIEAVMEACADAIGRAIHKA